MWFIDIIHDLPWLQKNQGVLPAPSLRGNIGFETDPSLKAELQMYSDGSGPRHFRILLPTILTSEECQKFINLRLGKIIVSIETAISVQIDGPFDICRPFGDQHLMLSPGQCEPDEIPSKVFFASIQSRQIPAFDAAVTGGLLGSIQQPGAEEYLFHLKRGMDFRLDVDYRWSSYYRVCERRFCQSGKISLHKQTAWRQFLEARRDNIGPLMVDLKPGQKPSGYLETLRAVAMHTNGITPFGHDVRLQQTLPLIRYLAAEVINDVLPDKTFRLLSRREDGSLISE